MPALLARMHAVCKSELPNVLTRGRARHEPVLPMLRLLDSALPHAHVYVYAYPSNMSSDSATKSRISAVSLFLWLAGISCTTSNFTDKNLHERGIP